MIGASILMASTAGLQSLPRFLLTNPITILALFRILRGGLPPRAPISFPSATVSVMTGSESFSL